VLIFLLNCAKSTTKTQRRVEYNVMQQDELYYYLRDCNAGLMKNFRKSKFIGLSIA